MAFQLEEFIDNFDKNPSLELLDDLRKSELLDVGKHYGLDVKHAMRKAEIQEIIVDHLVGMKVLPQDALPKLTVPHFDPDFELKRLEMERKFTLENKRLEAEQENKRLELQAEVEKERIRAEVEIAAKRSESESKVVQMQLNHFDASRQIRLVPPFNEKAVDKYFSQFEKLAERLKWPTDYWTTLLQSVLKGKAQEVFSKLTAEQSYDYEHVKKCILNAYELVPEAYRQKFRNFKKFDGQTYVEFAREKETLFDRWCESKAIRDDFSNLRELMLVEEFKNCIPVELRTYIDEQKASKVHDAAILADEYALTHKSFTPKGKFHYAAKNSDDFTKSNTEQNNKAQASYSQPKTLNSQSSSSHQKVSFSPKTCAYCKKPGHLISECFKRKNKASPHSFISPSLDTPLIANGCGPVQSVIDSKSNILDIPEEVVGDRFKPFISEGFVSFVGDSHLQPIKILRDTGAFQSLILEEALPFSEKSSVGANVLISGVEGGVISVPLHKVDLHSDLVSGSVTVGVKSSLPVEGVSMLLGNDLAGGKVVPEIRVVKAPVVEASTEQLVEEFPDVFPACAVTRSQTRSKLSNEADFSLSDSFMSRVDETNNSSLSSSDQSKILDSLGRIKLAKEQEEDPEVSSLLLTAVDEKEIGTDPVGFYLKSGVLMRKFRPPDVSANEEWNVYHQIVVPKCYRSSILSLAHDHVLSGHLGVRKTLDRVQRHFYWPKMRQDVADYCRTCHSCQVTGKPNQVIPKAPLKPIPAFEEPFSRVIIDCVGPLPKSKTGNEYLLTIMCASTRFPEAIPLKKITAPNIVKALVKFFTMFGIPKVVQSDQGSNFMSKLFQQAMHELDVHQVSSSAYHPESQGALERFHQTLKSMLRNYCHEHTKDWDEGVPLLLFAIREVVQESIGFSPFELVYGHSVRGPLKLIKEKWLGDDYAQISLLQYVCDFKNRLHDALDVARENLKSAQDEMKTWYDKRSRDRSFSVGDKVLVLLPISGSSLQARYFGPYVVDRKINDLNYVIATPDRRKSKQLCHINMLKAYHERKGMDDSNVVPVSVSSCVNDDHDPPSPDISTTDIPDSHVKLKNSEVLSNLDVKLSHLTPDQSKELQCLISQYSHVFPDVPGRTNVIEHDVIIENTQPIKQHPYRANPMKLSQIRSEVQYMLENDFIELSNSNWSSPCILVPKPDGSVRFCTDFRKVNDCTKSDSYPIPRMDDCIDRVGNSKYLTKFDLLKGYWQVPLTAQAREISAFVTPDGLYQYKVMPFGMKNSGATFQRLMNRVIAGLENVYAYIDDVLVVSNDWSEHLNQIKAFFERCSEAQLTINLPKSEFCKATIVYLGHEIGQGKVRPIQDKVLAIAKYAEPTNRRGVMRFLGMAGYYRKFCPNFSDVAAPLTALLRKGVKFSWSPDCKTAFESIKAMLMSSPIPKAPDFDKPFKLAVDASDVGIGAVLLQEQNGVDHPVCYFSRKLDKHQKNYSTIEKEALALLLSLQHFDVYVCSSPASVVVYTDHNPLVFVNKMKNKNQRLLRWSILLQQYNVCITHIRGSDNVIADALSR